MPKREPLTVRAILTLYQRHSRSEGLHCPEAERHREYVFGLFVASCGDLEVSRAKPYHLTDFIEEHPSWKSSSTRRAKANMIRAAFAWACEQERIPRNPFLTVRYPEAERRPDMPDSVLDRLATLANKPYERALRFLRLTACRLSELCRATWVDMDLERGVWTIPAHKGRRYTGKAKVVALVPEAVALLREIAALDGATAGAIFRNTRGTVWNRITLGQQLRRMKERHGVKEKASLHGIRHRFGSAGIAAGAPIKLISQQMGHSTVAVTERYYVNLEGEIDAIREAAAKAIPKRNAG